MFSSKLSRAAALILLLGCEGRRSGADHAASAGAGGASGRVTVSGAQKEGYAGFGGRSAKDGKDGMDGVPCTVESKDQGSWTITCGDGTSVTIRNGIDGAAGSSCTAASTGNGTSTITCGATVVLVHDGQVGPAGQPGMDGKDGSNGANGMNGTNGADGVNGTNGADGVNGTNGANGMNGTNGADGKDGTSCTVSPSGTGESTIRCGDGTTVVVRNGANGVTPTCVSKYLGRGLSQLLCDGTATATLNTGYQPQLVAGDDHTCALQRDGGITCWGYHGPIDMPAAGQRYERVAATKGSTCAIATSGSLTCWGDYSFANYLRVAGPWVDVAMWAGATCVLAASGEVQCEGGGFRGFSLNLPAGSTGLDLFGGSEWIFCAVTPEGRPACRRLGTSASTTIAVADSWRAGRVKDVRYPCALFDDGTLDCQNGTTTTVDLSARLRRVSYHNGLNQICTVSLKGSACSSGYQSHLFSAAAVDFAAGSSHACILTENGSVQCEDKDPAIEVLKASLPNTSGFQKVAVDVSQHPNSLCALGSDSRVSCFGGLAGISVPDEPFVDVAVGTSHACGRTPEGKLKCWGHDPYWSNLPAHVTSPTVVSVSAREDWTCYVQAGVPPLLNRTYCTGPVGTFGLTPPGPSIQPVKVSQNGNATVCVVDDQDRVNCKGYAAYSTYWMSTAPAGEVVASAWAGYEHVCATMLNGEFQCSQGLHSLRRPANTAFVDVMLIGRNDACGLYGDGSVTCWGTYGASASFPLAGKKLRDIAAEGPCGILEDGTLTCWRIAPGPADVPETLR